MSFLKKWKRAAIVTATAALVLCSFSAPALAHGHGGGHHSGGYAVTGSNSHHSGGYAAASSSHHSSKRGVYCSYHDKYHKKKSSCKKYCKTHKTTHSNGKKHHVAGHH